MTIFHGGWKRAERNSSGPGVREVDHGSDHAFARDRVKVATLFSLTTRIRMGARIQRAASSVLLHASVPSALLRWPGEPTRVNADSVIAMATNRMKSASRNRSGSTARGQKMGMGANSNKRSGGRRTSTSSKTRGTSAMSGSRRRGSSGARKTARRGTRAMAASGSR